MTPDASTEPVARELRDLPPDWTIHPLDGGALLAFARARKLIWLNGAAGWTWLQLAAGTPTEACARDLAAQLGLSLAAARAAVEAVPREVAAGLAADEVAFQPTLRPAAAPAGFVAAGAGDYRIGGRTLRIACARPTDHARVAAALGHLAIPDNTAPDHLLKVPAGGDAVLDGAAAVALGRGDLMPALAHALFALWYRERADFLALHAGLVQLRGRGLLLPGASGHGKTTAVAALLALGGTYHGDDVTALAPAGGTATAFPFPPAIKAANVGRLTGLFPGLADAPEDRRADGTRLRLLAPPRASDAPTPVHAIVFPRFTEGAASAVVPVSPGSALERLAREWVVAGACPPEALDRLVGWLARTPAVELVYADPQAAMTALDALVDRL